MLENIPVKQSAIEIEAGSRKETMIGSLFVRQPRSVSIGRAGSREKP